MLSNFNLKLVVVILVENCQSEANMLNDLVKKMSEHDRQQERDIALSKQMQVFNLKDKERLSKEKQAQVYIILFL